VSDPYDLWSRIDSQEVRAQLGLQYRDPDGAITARDVDVQQVGRLNQQAYFRGYCHLRQADRTFRIDRIVECWDTESGEVIEDVEAFLRRAGD